MPNLQSAFRSAANGVRRAFSFEPLDVRWGSWQEAPHAVRYRRLWDYYESDGLYAAVLQAAHDTGIWTPSMLPLRNPTRRVVEFYASKLWPGACPDALPIVREEANGDALRDAIAQVWTWSNWDRNKQVAARWLPAYGDLFIKVRSDRPGRVFFQLIRPEFVTDLETDERGFVTYIRIDVPIAENTDRGVRAALHTEVWDKSLGTYREWVTTKSAETSVEELGTPRTETPLTAWGIDFIPIVHSKFRDTGDERGAAAIMGSIDKIDEANRLATRLHQLLFRYNKPSWVVSANMADKSGRPLPAPKLDGGALAGTVGDAEVTDDSVLYMPGLSTIESLIPTIDWKAALDALEAQLAEIQQDLPELAYYSLRDAGQELSGRAVQFLLGDAIDRAIEVRAMAEAALIRAHQMALTMGAAAGLPAFRKLGSYERGDFDHTFEPREIMPLTGLERTEEAKAEAEMYGLRVELGVSKTEAQRGMGYSDDDIAQFKVEREEEAQESAASAGAAFGQVLDRGGFGNGSSGGAVIERVNQ